MPHPAEVEIRWKRPAPPEVPAGCTGGRGAVAGRTAAGSRKPDRRGGNGHGVSGSTAGERGGRDGRKTVAPAADAAGTGPIPEPALPVQVQPADGTDGMCLPG